MEPLLPLRPFTEAELRVLKHLAVGKRDKEIANDLGLSLVTVKLHVKHVYIKLGLHTRTQVALWAVANGIAENPFKRGLKKGFLHACGACGHSWKIAEDQRDECCPSCKCPSPSTMVYYK